MKIRFGKIMLASLLMILSQRSWAQSLANLDLNTPANKQMISNKFTDLQVCNSSRETLQAAYNDCANNKHGAISFWQTPSFIIGDFAVGVGVGAILVATHCLGLCR